VAPRANHSGSGTQTFSYRMRIWGFFPELKRPPSNVLSNVLKCTSTPPLVFIVWCLIKHRDSANFTWKIDSLKPIHIWHAVPMPFPCHAVPLIHTCHAAPLPCSDSAVSFVKVRVVTGNIRTASPTV